MTRSASGLPFSQLPQSQQVEVHCLGLPLAVYREVRAHLLQCPGIEVDILPQAAATFHYGDSQAGGLRLRYSPEIDGAVWQRIEAILSYYGTRYGAWELMGSRSQ